MIGSFNKSISHDEFDKVLTFHIKDVNIKAYKINKNKEKFESFTVNETLPIIKPNNNWFLYVA